jgi:IclR family KDG regulon transcriptional repressor
MSVLDKINGILNLFLDLESELSLDEISARTGLNKTTARRLAISMIKAGWLRQPQPRKKYSLGMRFLDYAQALKRETPIVTIAQPYLAELGRVTDETVSLAVWDGKTAAICLSIHPNHPLRVTSYEGTMLTLHHSSIGKALLAELPDTEIVSMFRHPLRRFTPNTITDLDALLTHLRVVRKEGVAIDDEEGYEGVRGIAATIKSNGKVVMGAITVLGPSTRVTREKMAEYIPAVKNCAARISGALSGHDDKKQIVRRRGDQPGPR